jgi:hypothetical protein
MKSINSLFLLLFLCLSFSIQAETVDVTWTEKQEPFKAGIISGITAVKSDTSADYYVYEYKTYYLQYEKCLVRIDKTTNKTKILNFQFQDKKSKRYILNTAMIDSVLHVFSYFNNKKLNRIFVFDETVDISNMKLNNDPKKISELAYDSLNVINSDKIGLIISYNKNRVLMTYNYKTSKGESYGFEVYNKQFELEWKKFDDFLSSRSGYSLVDHILDDDGNVYGLERNFINKSDIDYNYTSSKVSLLFYPKSKNVSMLKEINLPNEAFVTAAQIAINGKNELVCTGVYANKGTRSAIGTFSYVLSPQLLIVVDSSATAFDKEMLLKGLTGKALNNVSEKIEKRKDFEDDFYYKLSKIHFNNDGSYDVIIEKNKEYQRSYYSGGMYGGGTTVINYHIYDDILLYRCNPNGTLKWAYKIPKTQHLSDQYRQLGSYCTYRNADGVLYLIYNLPTTSEGMFSLRPNNKTITMMRSYDNNGVEKISNIFDNPKISNTFCPVFSEQYKNGDLRVVRYNYTESGMFSGFGALTTVYGILKIK